MASIWKLRYLFFNIFQHKLFLFLLINKLQYINNCRYFISCFIWYFIVKTVYCTYRDVVIVVTLNEYMLCMSRISCYSVDAAEVWELCAALREWLLCGHDDVPRRRKFVLQGGKSTGTGRGCQSAFRVANHCRSLVGTYEYCTRKLHIYTVQYSTMRHCVLYFYM